MHHRRENPTQIGKVGQSVLSVNMVGGVYVLRVRRRLLVMSAFGGIVLLSLGAILSVITRLYCPILVNSNLTSTINLTWEVARINVTHSDQASGTQDSYQASGYQANFSHLPTLNHYCTLPAGGYKAWSQGVVTVMRPQISKNCSILFQGDQNEAKRVEYENKVWDSSEYDNYFDEWATSTACSRIKLEFTNNLYTTKEELEFPLAFLMNIHDTPQQIFRFLKVIYRPHNLYCLHYDIKTGDKMKNIVENVARCLDNVLVPRTRVNVVWGCYTVMEAQLACMQELFHARKALYPWRYAISLCGKELPLRTLREIVIILKRLNGTSALRQHKFPEGELKERFSRQVVIGPNNTCKLTRQRLGPVPHGVKIRKSLAYFSLTPEFIYFLLNNQVALDLHEYMKRAYNSEEHFFSTVYYMKGNILGFLTFSLLVIIA